MDNGNWYANSYRRNLVDMHIDDWNDAFLAKFDATNYVTLLKLANVQTAMVYANSSVGLCYWPTKTGRMHRNLKGRDILGETLNLCRAEGITTVVYYSEIFNNWAYDEHPQWRTVDLQGGHSRDPGKRPLLTNRYGLCCPNSDPHRDFIKAQLTELVDAYEFNGMYLDMSFWPVVCYCKNCRQRYANEIGGSIPEQIDWDDPSWTEFQAKRIDWMAEYSFHLTNHVKGLRNDLSVQHNYALSLYSWLLGIDHTSADAHDYLGGDRFDGYIDQSFVCKLFYNLTKNFPAEFHTSRCYPDLFEHTTLKSEDMLRSHTYLALAHNTAFLFIDGIDPDGSLDSAVYQRMGKVFGESKSFEPYLGGTLVEDVAIYFSFNSKIDLGKNGTRALLYVGDIMEDPIPHIESAMATTAALKEAHLPFGVITKKLIANLSKYGAVVLPSVDRYDDEEVHAFLDYARNGGHVYLSGGTAAKHFGAVLGVKYLGMTDESLTYISPTAAGAESFGGVHEGAAISVHGPQARVENLGGAQVLAGMLLPYTDPDDGTRFAAIHSDPPGIHTRHPSIVAKSIGKGSMVWSSFPLERIDNDPHRRIFLSLLEWGRSREVSFRSDAPPDVEITLFYQPDNNRHILHLVNLQERRTVLPVGDFSVAVNRGDRQLDRVLLLPDEERIDYRIDDQWVVLHIDELRINKMIAIVWA